MGVFRVHVVIRALLARTTREHGIVLGRLSFTRAMHAGERTLRRALEQAATNAVAVDGVLHALLRPYPPGGSLMEVTQGAAPHTLITCPVSRK